MLYAGTEVRDCAVADTNTEFHQRHRIQPRSFPPEPVTNRRRTATNVSVPWNSAWSCSENKETTWSLPCSSCMETARWHGADFRWPRRGICPIHGDGSLGYMYTVFVLLCILVVTSNHLIYLLLLKYTCNGTKWPKLCPLRICLFTQCFDTVGCMSGRSSGL